MDSDKCDLCGGSFARFRGYLMIPTAWGLKYRHKDGDCRWTPPSK